MASVNFVCRASKADKKGLSPVEMAINLNGERMYLALPIKETSANFTKLSTSKKGNYLQSLFETERAKVNEAVSKLAENSIPITIQNLKSYLIYGGIKPYTIEDLFNDYFRLINGTEKYLLVYKEFASYVNPKDNVKSINNALILGFMNLIKPKYKESTYFHKVAMLKSVVKFACDNGKLDSNPFVGVKMKKAKPVIEYLTEEEVETIKNKDFGCERLNKIRDLTIFQCSCGLAYIDLASLKKEDMQVINGTHCIIKNRQKTDITYYSVVLPNGVEIWNKYNGSLPILTNQKYNGFLKEIAAICGINKNLHTHLFRKTYATTLLNSNVPMELVSKSIGHSNSKTTASTYAAYQKQTIIENIVQNLK